MKRLWEMKWCPSIVTNTQSTSELNRTIHKAETLSQTPTTQELPATKKCTKVKNYQTSTGYLVTLTTEHTHAPSEINIFITPCFDLHKPHKKTHCA